MKKLFNNSLAMLLCMAMTVVFTACEPEPVNIDKDLKALAFLCEGQTIADGSTFTSSKHDESYEALGMTRFAPSINLIGDTDGKITVIVKSLNETMVEVCAFNGCQITLPYLDYTISASGDISADTPLPLDIHYTPTTSGGNEGHYAKAFVTAHYEGDETNAISFTLVMTNAKVE